MTVGRQETEEVDRAVAEEVYYIPADLEDMVMRVRHMEQE